MSLGALGASLLARGLRPLAILVSTLFLLSLGDAPAADDSRSRAGSRATRAPLRLVRDTRADITAPERAPQVVCDLDEARVRRRLRG